MKIPKALLIGGKRWRVVFKPLKDEYGLCLHDKLEIHIDSSSPRDQQEDTFLHEVLHACIPWRVVSKKKEEKVVREIAPRLLDVLKGLRWVR